MKHASLSTLLLQQHTRTQKFRVAQKTTKFAKSDFLRKTNEICDLGRNVTKNYLFVPGIRSLRFRLRLKFADAFNESAAKLLSYLDMHTGNPCNGLFKAARVFDPRQILTLSQDLGSYVGHIKLLDPTDVQLLEEWPIYVTLAKNEQFAADFNVVNFWQQMSSSGTGRLPKLASVALPVLLMPVSSVEVERSFSKTGQILSSQRHSMNDATYRGLAALYFNGDLGQN
jgi:hypothetical protein